MISVRSATSADIDAVLLTWWAAGSVPTVSDDAASVEQLIDRDRDALVEAERRMTAGGAVRMSAIVEDANGTANEFWSAAGYSLLGHQSRYVRNLSSG